ncbi:hypothetical protein HG536_0B01330 [Torulaspora globosa]|uniref:cysteine--tRNA ligase n=1 Tax=Torulaspora globosa TaxID=48254 RepID=A0A7G3ZCN5_9SACH|nr:uncharacterized protein HG536_0B01330 [Torulaspora globosa]QLL31271.1 hypothetical protein HG536_0B01330 [Torulaspora globosa]
MKNFGFSVRKFMSTGKVAQPKWIEPKVHKERPCLKLYNSLTREKEVFVPKSGGKLVTWYSCGPTVYDASHMGHARNYVSIDINRRILSDYFGYNVKFVQNVTDIDDKIIVRARQNYLFDKFVSRSEEHNMGDVVDALSVYVAKNMNLSGLETIESIRSAIETLNVDEEKLKNPKFNMHYNAVMRALKALESLEKKGFNDDIKDIYVPFLDSKFGSSVTDPEIFRKLPAYWEEQFDNDMRRLNVLPPTVTTRVSEYVPEIIEFVKKIIDNGYGYATDDGSVYFDTVKFDSSEKHDYAKNQPWNKGQLDLIKEGEGSLTSSNGGKKSANDFALWKASKPGEPRWISPWGSGRPGWHIECSVMASDILGECMDIHSGGIDLAFPHHDNEMAQSEACFESEQWVNYFLHTGHLHIEGQKMSKSLKNFITIDEALEKYSSRQLRLAFLLTQWNNQLDFKESLLLEVKSLENMFSNFFKNTRALKSDDSSRVSKKLGSREKDLLSYLEKVEEDIDCALCDNLSTPQCMKLLSELVNKSNTYISDAGADVRTEVLVAVCKYISKFFGIAGIPIREDQLGWYEGDVRQENNKEEQILPYVQCLAKFRDQVRQFAIDNRDPKKFLELTDKLRNEELLNLNVLLDDRSGQGALVKLISEEEKVRIVEEARQETEKRQAKKASEEAKRREREAKEKERLEKAKIPPQELFKQPELYSEWDEDGIPTKDKEGNAITKSMTKKLKKLWLQQEKLYKSVN